MGRPCAVRLRASEGTRVANRDLTTDVVLSLGLSSHCVELTEARKSQKGTRMPTNPNAIRIVSLVFLVVIAGSSRLARAPCPAGGRPLQRPCFRGGRNTP